MTDLNDLLDKPISWHQAASNPDVKLFLEDLQANILKGHGRHHAAHLFIGFHGLSPDKVAHVVRTIGRHCTSAANQLRNNRRYPPHLDGGTVRCFFLSASGYRALGEHAEMPDGQAFRAGMENRRSELSDPPRSDWGAPAWATHRPDAMLLLADASDHILNIQVGIIKQWLKLAGCHLLMVETGCSRPASSGKTATPRASNTSDTWTARSQASFSRRIWTGELESVAHEPKNTSDASGVIWEPAFKPSRFILRTRTGGLPLSAGSYFVFRKLEQNIRGFNAAEDELGRAIFGKGATPDQLDRAGAMVVGRFEDGTPLTASKAGTASGRPERIHLCSRCRWRSLPFHAHIRKTNPRGDVQRQVPLPDQTGDRRAHHGAAGDHVRAEAADEPGRQRVRRQGSRACSRLRTAVHGLHGQSRRPV